MPSRRWLFECAYHLAASCPRSGSTWGRAVLTALLLEDGELGIDQLGHALITSGRGQLERYSTAHPIASQRITCSSSIKASASRLVTARHKGRPISGATTSMRIGPRTFLSTWADLAVRCSRICWRLLSRSLIHSTGASGRPSRGSAPKEGSGSCHARAWSSQAIWLERPRGVHRAAQ